MANLSIPVCWRPAGTTKVSFLDKSNAPYANDEIAIVEPSTITFTATAACSDNAVFPFTIRISPSANDITGIVGNETPTVKLSALYKNINQRASLNMVLTDNATRTAYTIDSGKPVIRNDPHRTIPPYVYLVGFAVIAIAIYAWWRSRARQLPPQQRPEI